MELVSYVWPYTKYKLSELISNYYSSKVSIKTNSGPVIGNEVESSFGYKYTCFQGIPYGKAPVGDLRFKDPVPVEPWTEPLIATTETKACQQDMIMRKFTGTENCLHLNVYTKNINPDKLYPVMVFIHGGAFVLGSNTKDIYNPEYLLTKDVILVVINYRLGALGFLSIDDPTFQIPGNAGLKDQTLALKWVRDNVLHFGGDPKNVTIFGESAGGCSVHYHMISDISRGLFHKAISMSGTALVPWSICPMKNLPERLAKMVGWNGDGGNKKLVEVLQNASTESIITAQEKIMTREERNDYILFPFGPVVEPYTADQCFIPKEPILMIRDAWSKDLPAIFGGCSAEGLLFYRLTKKRPKIFETLAREFENIVPFELDINRRSEKCKEIGAAIKQFYFGATDPSVETLIPYTTLMSDKVFGHAIHRTVLSRLSLNDQAATYLYRFDFDGKMNFTKIIFADKGVKGACHGDDCAYLFKNALNGKPRKNTKEFSTFEAMVTYWTNFASTGDPNTPNISSSKQALPHWEPITDTTKSYKCINIADEISLIQPPEYERLKFWDSLYKDVELY